MQQINAQMLGSVSSKRKPAEMKLLWVFVSVFIVLMAIQECKTMAIKEGRTIQKFCCFIYFCKQQSLKNISKNNSSKIFKTLQEKSLKNFTVDTALVRCFVSKCSFTRNASYPRLHFRNSQKLSKQHFLENTCKIPFNFCLGG